MWKKVSDGLPDIDPNEPEQLIVCSTADYHPDLPEEFRRVVLCAVFYKGKFYNLEEWQAVDYDSLEEIEFDQKRITHYQLLPEPPID